MKRGKDYRKSQEGYEANRTYSTGEALDILSKFPKKKFDESVEIHVRLGIDPTKSDQQIRSAVVLPHGTGKALRIAAFTSTQQTEAKKSGADLIGGEELVEKISTSKNIDFDIAVATPEMMPKLAKIAKILGPKGLMPNPKSQTIGPKIGPLVESLKKGKASFKSDSGGNLHQVIGKRSFKADQLEENINAFLEEIKKNKPASLKGSLVKKMTISSTMSPSIIIKH